ncbi:exocyst complex component 7 [Hylaeus anthracinus]|uniref:exocyst complex component 7 n=1 Tax=Hylaeus volcanicus TaxID=313075 RepID=UPI0023B7781A|nr:exocyst complex component 7 [Hylaeus volcanicus]XP_053981147.1 exocyst complex component 7 [Hylaeus volcanicus]XP_053981148.1 exocyst complex component 7 [Hylaeus volcanicus]XP_053981149.1 exocyst complex component 7 [Hylaeus volcanicus]XP_054013706.1 exocyst complex component 7 [Hylaeus anthracinus]XP_054013707.1 exocyst complex component 7 [Hylaeus anthracinus]XP_054013708.1 exocyst complex component 7 [Hylaeus anthracinus]XP_054013709.1 exocyst complex component 7 [Hylaeus anthracinus]
MMHTTRADTSERRFEIQCKLEAEIVSLEVLKEAEERSRKLTNNVVGILSSLEQRLATLRRTILPVYNETGNLQAQQQNIERTLNALDHAIGYYGVCQEVEGAVRTGPGGSGDLDNFLEAMNRLYNAQRYFQKNNPSSVELENVTSLFGVGLNALYAEFNDILTRQSKPILPIVLLDLIGSDEDTSGEDAPQSLCPLPESILGDLLKITGWLEERGHHRHVEIYASVRSTIVLKSLQLLKEHQRSASGGSTHAGSPLPKAKFGNRYSLGTQEASGRRASKRLQHALEKKANRMLLKASQTTGLGLSLTTSRKPQPQLSVHSVEDTAPDEQEMENYLLLTVGLHKLMQAERSLVAKILPATLQAQVLEATVRDAMDLVAHDGESIATRAKRCIVRRDFSAVLVIFPILKHLGELKPDLERTVEGCDLALRSKFTSVLNTLNITGAKALEDFAESVRNESNSVLPKDGTVAESTSNVLVFLEQLAEYADTAGVVLRSSTDMEGTISMKQTENMYKIVLGTYIKKVLAQLNLALLSRSDTCYSDAALRTLFRLNNHNHVVNALRRSSLMELLLLAEPTAEQTYHDLLLRDKTSYVFNTFAKARTYLEPFDESGPVAKTLKERFLGFTKELEDVAKCQRSYSVPDARLREELRNELQQNIVPLYTTFHNKYHGISFSKNPTKYIKYTPKQVSALINTFFDTTA